MTSILHNPGEELMHPKLGVSKSADGLVAAAQREALIGALLGAYDGEVGALPPAADLSLSEGYVVQQAVFAARRRLTGYKLAATSVRARTGMGLSEPLVGRLGYRDIGAGLRPRPTSRPIYAEAELVLRLGRDLESREFPTSMEQLAECVDAVFAGIEICSSRYADDDVAPAGLVADNAFMHAVVLGDRLCGGWDEALMSCTVSLERPGHAPVVGKPEAVMDHPLNALAWLSDWLGRWGQGLRAGQYIASGSITGITAISLDEPVTALFGQFGKVTAAFDTSASRNAE